MAPGSSLYTPFGGMYHAPRCTPASNIPMAPGSSSLHSIRWYVSRTTVHTGVEHSHGAREQFSTLHSMVCITHHGAHRRRKTRVAYARPVYCDATKCES
jgi:hypothetical protein